MCVVSMVMDHYGDEWRRRQPPQWIPTNLSILPNTPSQQEIDEFRRLLERAREYDKHNNEPDCEMVNKKKVLKDLAQQLGVDISFIDEVG